MSRFQAAYNNLTRCGPVRKIAKGYKRSRIGGDDGGSHLSHLWRHRGQAQRTARRMHQVPPQGPRPIEKYGRKGNMMKWKEQLNGDCPKRDAHSVMERCDLICPDLSKVL